MTTNTGLARLIGQERIDYLARLANDPNNLTDRVRLRLWRVARGLSTGALADMMGLNKSSINQVEVGYGRSSGNVQRTNLDRYLKALGLTRNEFYAGPLVSPSVNIANRITLWRMLAGLSANELATLTHLPPGRVARWYTTRTKGRGENVLPEDVLLVSKTLGVPFDVLTQGLSAGGRDATDKDPVPLFRRDHKQQGFRTHPENISHNVRARRAGREAATSLTNGPVTGEGTATATVHGGRALTDNALAEVLAVAIVRALDEYTRASQAPTTGMDDVRVAAEPTRLPPRAALP